MDSWEKFEELKLASKNRFYNKLNMKSINDGDYEHAQQFWNTMKKKNLGYYRESCLKTDVLLLADVLETLPGSCLKHYKFEPVNFYKAPGLD